MKTVKRLWHTTSNHLPYYLFIDEAIFVNEFIYPYLRIAVNESCKKYLKYGGYFTIDRKLMNSIDLKMLEYYEETYL